MSESRERLERQKMIECLTEQPLSKIADAILARNAKIRHLEAIMNQRAPFDEAVANAVFRLQAKADKSIPEQAKDGQFIVKIGYAPASENQELHVCCYHKRGVRLTQDGGGEGAMIKAVVDAIETTGWARLSGNFAKGGKRVHENLWEGRFRRGG